MGTRNAINRIINTDHSKWSHAYNIIMVITIAASIIPLVFRRSNPLFVTIDIVTCFIFVADYLLRWYTFGIGTRHSRLRSLMLYPITPMAIIDLLSILPTIGIFSRTFKIFRVTRLFKILRILKIVRYYRPMRLMINVFRKESNALMTVFGFAMFYIFLTALIMFNSEEAINPETGEHIFETFFDALYWATCTLTTVGYGDICPVTNLGRFISMISALVGVAIIALPSGIVTASYIEELNKDKEKRMKKRMEKLEKLEKEKEIKS